MRWTALQHSADGIYCNATEGRDALLALETTMATATIRISAPFPESTTAKAPARSSKPWYRRVFDVLVEARMAQAEREINRLRRLSDLGPYRHLTLSELEAASLRTGQGELPFTRA
jgi:hypothetical protein